MHVVLKKASSKH